jgi:hypothetical protein
MKKWTIYTAILLLTACALEEDPVDGPAVGNNNGIPEITLNLTFPTPESPITRSITAVEENTIEHLYVLVFDEVGGNSSLLDDTYAYTLEATPGSGPGFISDSTGGSSINGHIKKVTLSFKTSPVKQRFVLLANLPAPLKTVINTGLTVGMTEAQIIDLLKFDASPWQTAQNIGTGNFTPIPMFGHITTAIDIDYAHQNQFPMAIDVNMIRSLAKINVGVDMNNTGNTGFGTIFTINNIYVCNASSSGYVAPLDDYLTPSAQPSSIGQVNLPSPDTRTPSVGFAFPTQTLLNTIYVPESDSITKAFLVVDAQYNGQTRFYRIDFTGGNGSHFIPLLRNHSYTINIVGIKADGYLSLADAIAAPAMTLNYTITVEGGGNINYMSVYNDRYLLGVSENEVVFDWEKKPIGANTTYYPLKVYSTLNSGEWSFEVPGIDFTAIKHSSTELRITASNENHTGGERTPTIIKLKAGFITQEITVRQTGGANSAVLKIPTSSATGTVRIPLAFAHKARLSDNIFNGKLMEHFKVKVIWQEKGTGLNFKAERSVTSGSVTDQYITVTATASSAASNKYSNALVALMWENPEGPGMVGGKTPYQIVWSWHVWSMPEEKGNDVYGGDVNTNYHDPNQSLLMKRPLGKGYNTASHTGLFYQWGRKDPFVWDVTLTGASSVEKAPVYADTDTLVNFYLESEPSPDQPYVLKESFKFPTTFFTSSTNWLPGNNGALWNLSGDLKTYYDPCPEGWRVPLYYPDSHMTPWRNDALSYITAARNEFKNGILSASSAAHASGDGEVWTASPNGAQAHYTVISSGAVTHTGSGERAVGRSVRCVKDLKRKY